MKLSNRNFTYLCFLLSCILIVALYLFNQTPNNQAPIPEASHTYSTLTDVKAIEFTKQGRIDRQLISPLIKHYTTSLENIIHSPIIRITKNNSPWKITANKAILLNKNKKIVLEGNVKISQYNHGKKISQLLTSKLFYYPDSQQINTTEKITYLNQGITLESKGMHADLNNETIELISNAKGIYKANA